LERSRGDGAGNYRGGGIARLARPAVSHALWVLVLIKLLTPPVWTFHLPGVVRADGTTAGGSVVISEDRVVSAEGINADGYWGATRAQSFGVGRGGFAWLMVRWDALGFWSGGWRGSGQS